MVNRPLWILLAPALRPRFPSMSSIYLAFWAAAAWSPPPVAKSSIKAPTSSYNPSSAMALLITAWKWGGTFRGPKGKTSHAIKSSSVQQPNFSTLLSSTGICQKPENRSTMVQIFMWPTFYTTSRIYGMGKLLRFVR